MNFSTKNIIIRKSKALHGQVNIQGSKNAASKLLGAVLLSESGSILNYPKIIDFEILLSFLKKSGYKINTSGNSVVISANKLKHNLVIPKSYTSQSRSFLLLLVGLLAHNHNVSFRKPRGCEIGARSIDLYLRVLQQFGVNVEQNGDLLKLSVKKFIPAVIKLEYPSVVATSIAIMAGCKSDDNTIIKGASLEPEIISLINCLNSSGVKISTNKNDKIINIQAGTIIRPINTITPPDRNVLFTYIIAALLTRGVVLFTNCFVPHITDDQALLDFFNKFNVKAKFDKNGLLIDASSFVSISAKVVADWYPSFQTDWQPLIAPLLLQASGSSTIKDYIFENRMEYWQEFTKMGVESELLRTNKIKFMGPQIAVGTTVVATDIRAGAALILLGLVSTNHTTIENTLQIGRGYEDIVKDLKQIGAEIAYA